LGSAERRAGWLLRYGTQLAFPTARTEEYLAYHREVLSGRWTARIAEMQNRVPRGEAMLAWLDTPFLLDYARNPITDVDVTGLAAPWAMLPPVRYVLWQYQGYGVRSLADYEDKVYWQGAFEKRVGLVGIRMIRWLKEIAGRSDILADDGEIVLFRTVKPLPVRKVSGI
jgi:hypothetical protein